MTTVRASVKMPCESRDLADCRGVPFVADHVTYEHSILSDGYELADVTVFGQTAPGCGWDCGSQTNLDVQHLPGEPLPAWLPTPPDGWDMGVRIEIERRAMDAEAVTA